MFTSVWKTGKTTLVSLLLSRRALADGGTLCGLAVKPGKTVIITEESRQLWAQRARRQGFGGQVCFIPQPFRALPTPEEWQALIACVLGLQAEHGIDLLVIDPLAHFLRCENSAATMLATIMPLRELTARGLAVLVLHHPSKSHKSLGHSARGSSALLGHADIILEMRSPGGDAQTRRRRFLAHSRFENTPSQMLLELNPEGTEYVSVPESQTDEFAANWEVLNMVLEDALQKLTRRDILLEWPEDFAKPDASTLLRWLSKAIERQIVLHEGTGRRNDPFRYWLPATEEKWKADPLYELFEPIKRQCPFQPLHRAADKIQLEFGDDDEDDQDV